MQLLQEKFHLSGDDTLLITSYIGGKLFLHLVWIKIAMYEHLFACYMSMDHLRFVKQT